jgi:two-component system, sensor histidine kinase LadS
MFFTELHSLAMRADVPYKWRSGLALAIAFWSVVLGWAQLAQAQSTESPRVMQIIAPAKSLAVPSVLTSFNIPLNGVLEPDALWQQNQAASHPVNPKGLWSVGVEQRTASKFSISAQAEHMYTLEFPLARLDLVDVFWRESGKPWNHAQAGDTVALSKWPVVGQYPTFVLHFESLPGTMDVLVVMQNAGFAQVAAILSADRESREHRLLQANTAGLMIGASAMVLLVCLLMAAVYRSRSTAYLLAYSATVTLGAMVINGYGAVWFTPEWPVFNDAIKPFASTLICIATLTACMASLERSTVGNGARLVSWATVVLLLGYAAAQVSLLAPAWRLPGGVASATLATAVSAGLSMNSWRRGDSFAPWVLFAAICLALSAVVVARGFVLVRGVDLFATLTTVFLLTSILALRHVLILRERHGRAVLGRAEINRYRDPLTALLSYEGFEQAVENLSVRQHSGGGVAHVLYFSLLELDSFKAEDGYLVWQRDLVRFAAVLHKALGEGWHIGRLSNSKFGAVRLDEHRKLLTEPLLTLVLSSCSRKIDTQGWVDRVGLRMAGVSTPLTSSGLKESLSILEQSVRDLPPGKRIALL